MKTELRKHTMLLFFALILAAVFCAVMPSARAYAGNVRISNKNVFLYTNGGRKRIQLSLYDDDQKVSAVWVSSKKKIASVSATGLVTAKKKGTAKITAIYGGRRYTCRIKVFGTSPVYKKAIKAYNRFLMNPYVTYNNRGATGQADNFYSVDLDGNGIPELLVCVVSGNSRYYVLYHYTNKRISIGQDLGACGDFIWFPACRVMSYRQYQSDQTLTFWSRDNGTTLNSMAIARYKNGREYYYMTDGSIGTYGTRISATEFRNYVDHDILNYASAKAVTMHVNTPYNRSRFLK